MKTHSFVRDPPADLGNLHSDCWGCGREMWSCICDNLPSYAEVRDHPSLYLHEHAGAK